MQRNQVTDKFSTNKPVDPLVEEHAREERRRQADAQLDSGAKKWRFPIEGDAQRKRQ